MAKTVSKLGEEGKVAIRNVRRDAMKAIEKLEKDGSIGGGLPAGFGFVGADSQRRKAALAVVGAGWVGVNARPCLCALDPGVCCAASACLKLERDSIGGGAVGAGCNHGFGAQAAAGAAGGSAAPTGLHTARPCPLLQRTSARAWRMPCRS